MTFANQPPFYNLFFLPVGKLIDKKINITNKFGHNETKGFRSNAILFQHNFDKYLKLNEIQRLKGKMLVSKLSKILNCIDDTSSKRLNFYIFPLLSPKRDRIVEYLWNNGIESGKHFSNSINIAKMHGYRESMCPNSERIVQEIYTIPSSYTLTDREIEKIVRCLKSLH